MATFATTPWPAAPQAPIEVSPAQVGDRLSALRLLPPTDQEMMASLRRYGQPSLLVVFRDGERGLEIIDSFRRRRAATAHSWPSQLVVRVLDVDEPRALAALMSLHRAGAGLCEIEEAWVVRALVREHGLAQADVAKLLRRRQSWVSRRMLLVERSRRNVPADVRAAAGQPDGGAGGGPLAARHTADRGADHRPAGDEHPGGGQAGRRPGGGAFGQVSKPNRNVRSLAR